MPSCYLTAVCDFQHSGDGDRAAWGSLKWQRKQTSRPRQHSPTQLVWSMRGCRRKENSPKPIGDLCNIDFKAVSIYEWNPTVYDTPTTPVRSAPRDMRNEVQLSDEGFSHYYCDRQPFTVCVSQWLWKIHLILQYYSFKVSLSINLFVEMCEGNGEA